MKTSSPPALIHERHSLSGFTDAHSRPTRRGAFQGERRSERHTLERRGCAGHHYIRWITRSLPRLSPGVPARVGLVFSVTSATVVGTDAQGLPLCCEYAAAAAAAPSPTADCGVDRRRLNVAVRATSGRARTGRSAGCRAYSSRSLTGRADLGILETAPARFGNKVTGGARRPQWLGPAHTNAVLQRRARSAGMP